MQRATSAPARKTIWPIGVLMPIERVAPLVGPPHAGAVQEGEEP